MSSSKLKGHNKGTFHSIDTQINPKLSFEKLDLKVLKSSKDELTFIYKKSLRSLDSHDIRKFICSTLMGICEINYYLLKEDSEVLEIIKNQASLPFFSNYVNDIQFKESIVKIMKESEVQISTLILAIIYFNQFIERNNYYIIKNNYYK